MLAREDIDDLLKRHANVRSADGEKIGPVGQVYADDADGQPSWLTVKTGLFGMSESFVPLEGARIDGDDIVVLYSKDQIKAAPRIDAGGHLEPSEEDRLYGHYQLSGGTRTYTEAVTGGYDDAGGTAGGVLPGPPVDDAITRSGERLQPGSGQQSAGRARLRRYFTGNAAAGEEGPRGRTQAGGSDGVRG